MKQFILSLLVGFLMGSVGIFGVLYTQSTEEVDKGLSPFQRTQQASMTLWRALNSKSKS